MTSDDSAISPTVAVVLLVGVTVILSVSVGVFVFNLVPTGDASTIGQSGTAQVSVSTSEATVQRMTGSDTPLTGLKLSLKSGGKTAVVSNITSTGSFTASGDTSLIDGTTLDGSAIGGDDQFSPGETVTVPLNSSELGTTVSVTAVDTTTETLVVSTEKTVYQSSATLLSSSTSLSWWDSRFDQRRAIHIYNPGAELSNHQVRLNVSYDSDMQSDFSDLRFAYVNSSGEQVAVDYWIEDSTAGKWAEVWVEVPKLPADSHQSVYAYYGNSSVGSASNGKATFVFFDDFEDGGFSEWSRSHNVSLVTDSSGNTVAYVNESSKEYLHKNASWENVALGFDYQHKQKGAYGPRMSAYTRKTLDDAPSYGIQVEKGAGDTWQFVTFDEGGYEVQLGTSNYEFALDRWYDMETGVHTNRKSWVTIDERHLSSTNTTSERTGGILLDTWDDGNQVWFDDVYVRKTAPATLETGWEPETSQADSTGWWDDGWSKRKPVTVSNPNDEYLGNHQVKFTVSYDSDMQSDFSDLRFAYNGSDGVQHAMDYYVVSKSGGSQATVWVEVPFVVYNGSSQVYMYYGNSSATSVSSPRDTFLLYDDFEDGDFSEWDSTGNVSLVDDGTGNTVARVAVGSGKELYKNGGHNWEDVKMSLDYQHKQNNSTYGARFYAFVRDTPRNGRYGLAFEDDWKLVSEYEDSYHRISDSSTAFNLNTWYSVGISSRTDGKTRGTYKGKELTTAHSSLPGGGVGLDTWDNGNIFWADNVTVRHITGSEPSTTVGSEESR